MSSKKATTKKRQPAKAATAAPAKPKPKAKPKSPPKTKPTGKPNPKDGKGKAEADANPEHYAYIHAEIDDGSLTLRYKLNGGHVEGADGHDENVRDWSRNDLDKLIKNKLEVLSDDPVVINYI